MSTEESILVTVRGHLARARGSWVDVSQGSGVPYHTLTKIAQGVVVNPRVGTVQRLIDYFKANAKAEVQ